ncbi:MAG: tetraacyldisaccharide 4'-kinase [Pseudomonadota bacterium]
MSLTSPVRARIEAAVRRRWYGEPGWLRILTPLSVVTRWVARRRMSHRRLDPDIPTVVVGNLVVGGAGKTPLVLALVRRLLDAGARPGIISRGYGAASGHQARLVEGTEDASLVGDEPLLLARESGVPVAIARDRVAALSLLARRCDVIVSDDGLQHYALPRSVEIVAVKAPHFFGNGRLLPVGPLREPLDRLQAADLIVCVGSDVSATGAEAMKALPPEARATAVAMAANASGWQVWKAGMAPRRVPLAEGAADLAGRSPLALAGIAHPEDFFADLDALGISHEAYDLGDHGSALPELRTGRVVVTTAKDQARLDPALGALECWVLERELRADAAAERALESLVRRLVAQRRA